ncbi:MAG: CorA family divalent cation transporter, partial [Bilophila wadsworthia]
ALRLVTRLSELLQHCQFVLQQQTDQRLRQLTVLSAIFMPLTLITGVYGMNFAYMPETGWRYGYYATLAGMVWLAIFLWITLKRKGWFR